MATTLPPPPPPLPPPPVPLADLDVDVQGLILRRIPCSVDRGRMSLVCRAWRKMMSRLVGCLVPPPRPLPWMLLPPPAPFAAGPIRAACVLSGCRIHHHLALAPPGARCFGSHDGAWLFLRTPEPVLLNVRTGDTRALPTVLRNPHDDPRARHMVFLAAALSARPEGPLCVVGAVVSSWIDEEDPAAAAAVLRPLPPHQCRMALCAWERADALDINSAAMVEDVAYRGGAFLFLTVNEHLRVVTPVRNVDGDLGVQRDIRLFKPPGGRGYDYGGNNIIRARYLVASPDELLMVVRLAPQSQTPWTTAFKVFQATELETPEADAKFPKAIYTWRWTELGTMGGRMLFLGRGCSRSYKADDYPGFRDGVYFLDDGEYYEEAKIIDGDAMRQYGCSDNGKCSDGCIHRCFPRTGPSDHFPPAWLLS